MKLHRYGYTTGACAAAAAKAATIALIRRKHVSHVDIRLPIGKTVRFKIHRCSWGSRQATAAVVKDAGDSPDCTNHAQITATVGNASSGGIVIDGGSGVGRVTQPGTGLTVGTAAINPVPRRMILHAVRAAFQRNHKRIHSIHLSVRISVPGGYAMSRRTLNSRLGIIGGISILGTTGIVTPFSTKAYRATISQAIRVAAASKLPAVVLTTGGRSEKFAKHIYSRLSPASFIQMGDHVGAALRAAIRSGVKDIRIVGLPGKISKIAQGRMMTHCSESKISPRFLSGVARICGAERNITRMIASARTARRVHEIVEKFGPAGFFLRIAAEAARQCTCFSGRKANLSCIITDYDGKILGSYGHHK